MATATPRAAEPAAPWRGDDFPSWLSPMLVKELRQGIQSGVFAWTFISLQVVMFLVMATALAGRDSGFRDSPALFWVPVTLAVAVVIPLRGLGAVSAERAGNNLDLVRLTHLSARKIVTGKWLAIVAQSALLATAALPYLVLRYFFGGVNVVADLVAFAWMLVAAMLVAAAAVAGSTRPVRERIALVILLVIVGNGLLQAAAFAFGMGGAATRTPPLMGLAFAGLYTVLLLESAAAIAPAAANHAAAKRAVALAIAAAWLATAVLGGRDVFPIVAWVTILPLAGVAIEALCERPSRLTSIYAPFARRGAAGRAAALVLTPGWTSGLTLVTLLGAVCTGALVTYAWRYDRPDVGSSACMAILTLAAILFPLPAVVAFMSTSRRHVVYGVVQVTCLVVLALSGMLAVRGSETLAPVAMFPLAALLRAIGGTDQDRFTLAVAAVVVTLVVFGLVVGPWLRELAVARRLLDAARGRQRDAAAEAGA